MAIFQTTAPFNGATQAQFQTWGQSFGQALSSLGWVKQTGHGEQTDNGGTGTGYAWTNSPAIFSAFSTTSYLTSMPQAYTFKGAWVSGATYVGANSNNSALEVDVVTSGGLTYFHYTATSSSATAPGSDTTNWMPLYFEIWKSNGPMSATFPLYLKIYFVWQNTTAPCLLITVGTGVDVNGNITGAAVWGGNTPNYILQFDLHGAAVSSTLYDMDFAGDADNLRFAVWKTYNSGNAGVPVVFVMDRAKTATGTDSDAFVYLAAVGSSTNIRSAVFMKPSLGSTVMADTSRWAGIVTATPTSTANFGAIPPYPIFPIVGYLGNPVKGVVTFARGDVTEGTLVPVWIYGASHNYLTVGNVVAALSPDGTPGRCYPAILWE